MQSLERARAIVERHFRVYEAREERMPPDASAQVFFVMFPAAEFDRRFEAAKKELQAENPELLVFMRTEGGEDILVVATRPPVAPRRTRVHLLLLALTVLTTTSVGALFWASYTGSEEAAMTSLLNPAFLGWGFLTFSLPLMAILGIHEMAHFYAAKRHGLRASLPYFIPVPPFLLPIGTLGAFISLKDPMPDRKALFDVGASGPLAGFLVAIPIVIAGAWLTGVGAVEIPDEGRPMVEFQGDFEELLAKPGVTTLRLLDPEQGTQLLSITAPDDVDEWPYTVTATATIDGDKVVDTMTGTLEPGETALRRVIILEDTDTMSVEVTWEDGLVSFGDPLLVKGLDAVGLGSGGYLTHPLFFAGWVGLLVTGINLLPLGQLDGGHVARAVFGERMRVVAYIALGGLMMLVLFLQSWILIALFVLLLGIQHPPPLNDRTKLDRKRMIAAVLVLVVFIVTFVPQPVIV